MKIAIVGSGIAGNTIAHLLYRQHDITVFEKNSRIGGHSHTHQIELENKQINVDTGFIVFNKKTYPLFTNLMDKLGVAYENSNMSFSVFSEENNVEYNGTSINTLFSQRKNIFNVNFLKMIFEIVRFNRQAPKLLNTDVEISLGAYLSKQRYSNYFKNYYILPMGSAIWSSNMQTMLDFPAKFFIQFFHNHGMLSVNNRPQWLTITNGSSNYVDKLTQPFKANIKLNTSIKEITRAKESVNIRYDGIKEQFDYVFFACHSDEALKLLGDVSLAEHQILSAIPYAENNVVLHTDRSLLPKKKLSWAAWNYNIDNDLQTPIKLTYNMNILQNIDTVDPLLVSLNSIAQINKNKILKIIHYHHPTFTLQAIAAQKQKNKISGVNRTFYAGAYWGNGFHEDGVKSAYDAVDQFNHLIA